MERHPPRARPRRRHRAAQGPAGKDLIKWGASRLDDTLLRARLIDELQVWVMPVVVGAGQRLFEDVDTSSVELRSPTSASSNLTPPLIHLAHARPRAPARQRLGHSHIHPALQRRAAHRSRERQMRHRPGDLPLPGRRPSAHDVALVLGGGGAAGNAWTIGVLAGLAEAGLDMTEAADVVIGTSSGAIAAARVRSGMPPAELLASVLTPRAQSGRTEPRTTAGPTDGHGVRAHESHLRRRHLGSGASTCDGRIRVWSATRSSDPRPASTAPWSPPGCHLMNGQPGR